MKTRTTQYSWLRLQRGFGLICVSAPMMFFAFAAQAQADAVLPPIGGHNHTTHNWPPAASPPVKAAHDFMPPTFNDGVRLWAWVDAAQGKKNGGKCAGLKAGRAYCRMQGFSGALQPGADGAPGLTFGAVRPENKVRAVNGDICTAYSCVAISGLHCSP